MGDSAHRSLTRAKIFQNCAIVNRRSIASVGVILVGGLRESDAHDFLHCGGSNRLARTRGECRNICRCRESSQESLATISNGLLSAALLRLTFVN